MDRRLFFKKSCNAVCLLAYRGIFPFANGSKARFGLMTDISNSAETGKWSDNFKFSFSTQSKY